MNINESVCKLLLKEIKGYIVKSIQNSFPLTTKKRQTTIILDISLLGFLLSKQDFPGGILHLFHLSSVSFLFLFRVFAHIYLLFCPWLASSSPSFCPCSSLARFHLHFRVLFIIGLLPPPSFCSFYTFFLLILLVNHYSLCSQHKQKN